MRVAITGAAGQIGHQLAHKLVNEGHSVSGLVRSENGENVLPEEADVLVGDVRDKNVINELVSECDGIAHLVHARGKVGDSVYIEGTKIVLNAAKEHGCETFVFTSSITEHPELVNTTGTKGSKLRADEYIRENSGDISWLVIYPSGVIGPGDYKMNKLAPYVTVVSNKLVIPPLYRFGYQNYVHIDTVIDAIVSGLSGECTGNEPVCGKNLTDHEYHSLIAKHSPRDHWIPRLYGMQRLLPSLLNIASKINLVPKKDYTEMNTTENSFSVPEHWQDRSPVPNHGTEKAVADSIEWYEQAGLL
ncbi:NAD-dependent epimerase/dehydratase family protein [Halorientalis marina]|uniref:NAD-dependent epimerase/dehydratase family protein n=1 Tax=Halorientalis marina TaxID=2931976 RepID=UPI001FF6BE26|nr:NAD(P)-dependent oxidoreductase [Halorientalis marina]